jgi:succinate dehydrogenase / fumarate reductase flavoprotein subunit
MERYDPERLELSTRDRVALANYSEIVAGRGGPHGGVFLDISHRPKDYIREKLPRMYRQFLETQMLDISRERMEVAPTAHYSMGGLVVEPDSHATAVAGLYAAGEVTGGVHGANRLGGNSLVETLVFGRRAGAAAAAYSQARETRVRAGAAVAAANEDLDGLIGEGDELARPLQRALRDAMWECCGVVRDEGRLRRGLDRVAELRAALPHLDVRPDAEGYQDLAHALDLRGSLLAAEATLRGALERRESRGAHQRSDHPALDAALRVNVTIERRGDELTLSRHPVPEVPAELRRWVEEADEVAVAGRLLE